MKVSKLSLQFLGFLQATGLLIYITLVALFMFNANKIFGPISGLFGPIAFLLLFIISAIISSLLVLGRAGYLFWEKRYKEAFSLVFWTLIWSVIYLVTVLLILPKIP